MNIESFVDNYIDNLNSINESNIKKYDYELIEKLKPKETKEIKSYKEMKKFTDSRKKFYDKQTNIDNEENFDIFENNNINIGNSSMNFFDLEPEKKLNHIIDYIKRKKYKLSCDLNKIDYLLYDNDLLKKYISIDKTFNIINKISFLKKMETGDYDIVLNNNTKKTTKKKFFN